MEWQESTPLVDGVAAIAMPKPRKRHLRKWLAAAAIAFVALVATASVAVASTDTSFEDLKEIVQDKPAPNCGCVLPPKSARPFVESGIAQ